MICGSGVLPGLCKRRDRERGMKEAWVSLVLLAALAASTVASAVAAELTGTDRRYLAAEYGIGRQDPTVAALSAGQQKQLHLLITDPQLKDVPAVRHDRVAAFLFDAHMRACQETASSHPNLVCPPVADAKVEPGKDIADRQCNFCHLFGVGRSPSFYKLARQGPWAGAGLAEAQRRGHENARRHGQQMSPVQLTREQYEELVVYIDSLK